MDLKEEFNEKYLEIILEEKGLEGDETLTGDERYSFWMKAEGLVMDGGM